MSRFVSIFALAPLAVLGACALQPEYERPTLGVSPSWSNASSAPAPAAPVIRDNWWTLLGDPAVDTLVAAGLRDNPTLAEAAARLDQARAAVATGQAARLPSLAVEASAARSRNRDGSGAASIGQTTTAAGVRLSWELDLWGRVRNNKNAAQYRLTASTADAGAARLSVIGEIADTALALRACNLTLEIRDRDLASREAELTITRARLTFGNVAPVAVASVVSSLASAQTDRIAQRETCQHLTNALAALSGLDEPSVQELFLKKARLSDGPEIGDINIDMQIPNPPPFAPELPALVLLQHPAVIAAEREVAARWSEIAVARAERLPRIDLTALLSQQWIRALGSTAPSLDRSAEAGLTAPLFDGGAGAASVRGAEARYREAVARLDFTVRMAVRDIEDALAAQQSALGRIETSGETLKAAAFTLNANVARLRAGAIAPLELEESRRQFNRAQENAIVAAADRARVWVALVRQTGAPWEAPVTGAVASLGETPRFEEGSGRHGR